MHRREVWLGNSQRFGILQRLGIACLILSSGLVVFAFNARAGAMFAYWLFAAAHALLYTGFTIAALADSYARRPFSVGRLIYTLVMAFAYALTGPIVMAAAQAASHGVAEGEPLAGMAFILIRFVA